MKKLITITLLGATLTSQTFAGDREWATVGKVLTGVVAIRVIDRIVNPPTQVVYYQPQPVVYAQPVVYVQPQPVVYAQPVVYVQPQPVVYAQPVVYVQPQPAVYCQPTTVVYIQPRPVVAYDGWVRPVQPNHYHHGGDGWVRPVHPNHYHRR